ncbi:hypothetical protein M011DRAFT_467463 [Sporormia fimetaria CBS 119925]|uniref:Secreted protein n=1 Tax=Sporormia fimetaria CBS 119925 TaxID=1340428 RepID=A0A6A6VDR2_9PLEO|nr:hypothetical protein M011DRAFT_467463 [Sporormia fimetaria CBS 119925]
MRREFLEIALLSLQVLTLGVVHFSNRTMKHQATSSLHTKCRRVYSTTRTKMSCNPKSLITTSPITTSPKLIPSNSHLEILAAITQRMRHKIARLTASRA